jgi:ABC-type nitrate/sulfonate/bicarbonate transport system permease component
MKSAASEQLTARGGRHHAGRPAVPLARRFLDAKLTWRLLTLAIIAGIWQAYAVLVGGLLIPTVGGTMLAFGGLLADAQFWGAVWVSNQSLIFGFAIAVVLGIPIGLLMGRFRAAEKFTDVYINILLVTPMAAIIPLLIMSLGFGLTSRILLVVLFAIPMVIVNSRAGVRQVDPNLIEMGYSFGASERALWWRVLLPGSMPAVMTGIRIGLGRAITAMVIIELLMIAVGLGGLIINFRGAFQPDGLYAVVLFVVIEALILISFVRWLERRLVPWAREGVLAVD